MHIVVGQINKSLNQLTLYGVNYASGLNEDTGWGGFASGTLQRTQ